VGDSRSANFILYRSDRGSMFDHQAMVDALEFHLSYTTTMSGPSSLDAAGSKTYQDFCFKKWYPDGPCSDNSFFSIWDNDVDNIPATSQEIMYASRPRRGTERAESRARAKRASKQEEERAAAAEAGRIEGRERSEQARRRRKGCCGGSGQNRGARAKRASKKKKKKGLLRRKRAESRGASKKKKKGLLRRKRGRISGCRGETPRTPPAAGEVAHAPSPPLRPARSHMPPHPPCGRRGPCSSNIHDVF
jgi:hypothetical protein